MSLQYWEVTKSPHGFYPMTFTWFTWPFSLLSRILMSQAMAAFLVPNLIFVCSAPWGFHKLCWSSASCGISLPNFSAPPFAKLMNRHGENGVQNIMLTSLNSPSLLIEASQALPSLKTLPYFKTDFSYFLVILVVGLVQYKLHHHREKWESIAFDLNGVPWLTSHNTVRPVREYLILLPCDVFASYGNFLSFYPLSSFNMIPLVHDVPCPWCEYCFVLFLTSWDKNPAGRHLVPSLKYKMEHLCGTGPGYKALSMSLTPHPWQLTTMKQVAGLI